MENLQIEAADLRKIFEHSITVRDISSIFIYHSGDNIIQSVKIEMEKNNFDTAGVEKDGITGYVVRTELETRKSLDTIIRQFQPNELISETTPLIDLFPILKVRERVFVLTKNKIDRIVTRYDLQKAPVRMLIFGFISILEMHLLRIIKGIYPADSWQRLLNNNRIRLAKKLYSERKARNEELDLVDYIQLADKRDLLLENMAVLKKVGFKSKKPFKMFFKKVEVLRNKLAHSQELVKGSSWPDIIDLTIDVEKLIRQMEAI